MKKFILSCLFFVYAIPTHATTLIHKNFVDLVKEADRVVMGTVRSIESRYDSENEISTFVTLDQLNILYGNYGQATLNMRIKGGQVGTQVVHIDGSPHFQLGDRVLLFLRVTNTSAIVPIVGWTQGVFRVAFDESSGQEIITDHDGNPVLGIEGSTLVKESRHSSESFIVDPIMGTTLPDPGLSGKGDDVSPGIPDDSRSVEHIQTQLQTTSPDRKAMVLQSFLDAVAERLNQKVIEQRTLQGKPQQ